MTLVASAPGKLILLGEHAAVYRYPAVTTTIGLRVEATFEAASERTGEFQIELPNLGLSFRSDEVALRRSSAEARRAWDEWISDPAPEKFPAMGDSGADGLVRIACGEALEALAAPGRRLGGRLTVRSKIPLGAGFGSSAATATAVIAVLLAAVGGTSLAGTSLAERVEPIALEVERRQHGRPSGVDHNTVLRGGTLVARSGKAGDRSYERIDADRCTLGALRVFDTGTPQASTGEVVAAVSKRRRMNPQQTDRVLREMGSLVESSVEVLGGGGEGLGTLLRAYEACLEAIGVVPERVQDTIRAIEASGGSAKISGAGCHTGETAGCLLVATDGDLPEELRAFRELDVALGVPGLEVNGV